MASPLSSQQGCLHVLQSCRWVMLTSCSMHRGHVLTKCRRIRSRLASVSCCPLMFRLPTSFSPDQKTTTVWIQRQYLGFWRRLSRSRLRRGRVEEAWNLRIMRILDQTRHHSKRSHRQWMTGRSASSRSNNLAASNRSNHLSITGRNAS